jgi:hypothetical protein
VCYQFANFEQLDKTEKRPVINIVLRDWSIQKYIEVTAGQARLKTAASGTVGKYRP